MKKPYLNLILAGIILVCFTGITIIGFWTEAYESQSFSTFLFLASYDWLSNFTDYNKKRVSTGPNSPDTDNFNKIITLDSNLFPLRTAVYGDVEFPNITSRNEPLINDYFNRSIAVAPDFMAYTTSNPYQTNAGDIQYTGELGITSYVKTIGARSFMKWAFITDPGNHNIRRYEFSKAEGYWLFDPDSGFNDEDFGGLLDGSEVSGQGVGQNDCSSCDDTHFYLVSLEDAFSKNKNSLNACKETYVNDVVFYFQRDAQTEHPETAADYKDYQTQEDHPGLELILTFQADQIQDPFKINVGGNSPDQASPLLYAGLNSKLNADNTVKDPGWSSKDAIQIVESDGSARLQAPQFGKTVITYTFTGVDTSFDLDGNLSNGVQLRLTLFPEGKGGFIIDTIGPDEDDSAFSVKDDGSSPWSVRWNNISSFLETVPPRSFPGYTQFRESNPTIGYGFKSNTSFSSAKNVRFKNPRDIDVYRDQFDILNKGPLYVFVADTMNSRIQVFMNATGSAGVTKADFPIRPVKVKGPRDTSATAHKTNELAMRPYKSVTGIPHGYAGSGFGDGRKADWRFYKTAQGTTFANSTIGAGRGDFYYPHGVAVDQDPDTKDVYLFVADTYNHRIQVFRDHSGVTNQGILAKAFDFQYEKGWGSYPLQTTQTVTDPGPYQFRYPKGLDIARFSNNSSYLYVVDAKDYRLLKYLITEKGDGGIKSVEAVAGYGYNGTTFTNSLLSKRGTPLEAHRSFEANKLTSIGFLNPQDVATGYSGFQMYSGPTYDGTAVHYQHKITVDSIDYGVQYLDNHMLYVTDAARNYTTLDADRLNMRVMQFVDRYPSITGVFLPWRTEAVAFGNTSNLPLGQTVYGIYSGYYNSEGEIDATKFRMRGSSGNIPGVSDYFTDRPVGVSTVIWNTDAPIDMRVIKNTSGAADSDVYLNGATIPTNTALRVGASTRAYFGFPETSRAQFLDYADYTKEFNQYLDGRGVKRIHLFWYNADGSFHHHDELRTVPYEFNSNGGTSGFKGFLKIVAEDKYFTTSGRSGTLFFRIQ